MKCSHCGEKVEKEWLYCPSCGFRIERRIFSDIFSRIKREFTRMDREMKNIEKEVEAFDLSPFFKRAKTGGFSIRIYRSGDKEPQVYIKTFGDVDKDKIEKAVYDQLGIKHKGLMEIRKRAREIQREERRRFIEANRIQKTEEPKTSVRSLGDRVVVDVELPGVKSVSDISVQELENSVEVRAVAGDKMYFKILTKPSQFRMISKSFSHGVLHLEFA